MYRRTNFFNFNARLALGDTERHTHSLRRSARALTVRIPLSPPRGLDVDRKGYDCVTGKNTAGEFRGCAMAGVDHLPPHDAPIKQVPFCHGVNKAAGTSVNEFDSNVVMGHPVGGRQGANPVVKY